MENEVKTQCVKVASLRRIFGDDINLKKWMNMENNLYVGRRGRVFITNEDKSKEIFVYKESKWKNDFKVGEGSGKYTLQESLELYKKHILGDEKLLDQLKELKGKTLGCFCDQSKGCHAKILVLLYDQKIQSDDTQIINELEFFKKTNHLDNLSAI